MAASSIAFKVLLSAVQLYNAKQAQEGRSDAEAEAFQNALEARNIELEDDALDISQDIVDGKNVSNFSD